MKLFVMIIYWVIWLESIRGVFDHMNKEDAVLWDRLHVVSSLLPLVSNDFNGIQFCFILENCEAVIS